MATVQDIPFRSIPHQSPLFLSYLDRLPQAVRFYHHAPDIGSVAALARDAIALRPFPRKEIGSVLRRQNEGFGGDAETLRQISELEKPDSVAILTGQQVGLFTGPAYTIYKALTALRVADELSKLGIRAVSVFWMDTDDHDLQEVTRRTVWEDSSAIRTMDYRTSLFQEARTPAGSVGSIRFPDAIRHVIDDYIGRLPESAWKSEVHSLLESAYKPGSTFAQSFARLMTKLFCGSGLIYFDPQDEEAKRLSSGVFQKALRDADPVRHALIQRTQELQAAGFHAQVGVGDHSTVLFLNDAGERRALERRASGFGLKNSERTYSAEELLECAGRNPELFSPNVLLRPLVQDSLFPTVAYVGGSSELAYFAQIEALYTLFGRPMPVVWPRNSFTLLEPEIAAEMERRGITLQDCFEGEPHVVEKAMRRSDYSATALRVETLCRHLDSVLTEIKPDMQAVDPTLASALETARRKMRHNIQHLKTRIARMESRQQPSVHDAVRLLLNHCYPNHALQEREWGIPHFLARHGYSVMETIRKGAEIGSFAHRVFRMEESA
jgi:bacillithiol biosynthesis cysteine-adding enzyme BshC